MQVKLEKTDEIYKIQWLYNLFIQKYYPPILTDQELEEYYTGANGFLLKYKGTEYEQYVYNLIDTWDKEVSRVNAEKRSTV